MYRAIVIMFLLLAGNSNAAIVTYEGDVHPETVGWTPVGSFDADTWVEGGWFFQFVELGVWAPPPFGEADFYQRSISAFAGEQTFFIEWRVKTQVPGSELGGIPVVFSATGTAAANYHFTITNEQVRLIRDNFLPIVFANVEPSVPHTHRLELHSDVLYAWYVDGQLIDSGLPEGLFPSSDSVVSWGSRYYFSDNTTRWDYVRYGTIPQPASGDFDSDGVVDQTDVFFFVDCLLGPDADGPGCRWADMNGDNVADGADIQLFAEAMIGP